MSKNHIVCIGAAMIDDSFFGKNEPIQGTSNPSDYYRSAGGVSRNVAHHLAQLGNQVELITHFGTDADGRWLMEECAKSGMKISNSAITNLPTGRYAAFLSPDGDLFIGAASTNFDTVITVEFLKEKVDVLKTASLIQLDCNLSAECLEWLIEFSRNENIPCVIDPVSVSKASRLKKADLSSVMLITPNSDELYAITDQPTNNNPDYLIQAILKRGVKNVWIRNGKDGSQIYSSDKVHSHSATTTKIVDATGAGDAALAGWIHAFLLQKSPDDCLAYGHSLAELILQTKGAVLDTLNPAMLELKTTYKSA